MRATRRLWLCRIYPLEWNQECNWMHRQHGLVRLLLTLTASPALQSARAAQIVDPFENRLLEGANSLLDRFHGHARCLITSLLGVLPSESLQIPSPGLNRQCPVSLSTTQIVFKSH